MNSYIKYSLISNEIQNSSIFEEENNSIHDLSRFPDIESQNGNNINFNLIKNNNNIFSNDIITDSEDLRLLEPNSLTTKRNPRQKKAKFIISRKRKRGPRSKIPRKRTRIHTSSDFDNLHRKIQVHFLTFIINVSNDAILAEFGKKSSSINLKTYLMMRKKLLIIQIQNI